MRADGLPRTNPLRRTAWLGRPSPPPRLLDRKKFSVQVSVEAAMRHVAERHGDTWQVPSGCGLGGMPFLCMAALSLGEFVCVAARG